jgi:hypothetical protein
MTKKVALKTLREVLESLGYAFEEAPNGLILFRHPDRNLFIILPRTSPDDELRPIDLYSVRKTLTLDGVIKDAEFDSLFRINKGDRLIWKEPSTGAEIRVTAAAGESDDLVVIERQGALIPCPVGQLRKESLIPADSLSA